MFEVMDRIPGKSQGSVVVRMGNTSVGDKEHGDEPWVECPSLHLVSQEVVPRNLERPTRCCLVVYHR